MKSRIIPVIIKIHPVRVKPFGFHASLLYISEGPTTSLLNAFAFAANIAADRLPVPIPPEPSKSKAPEAMKIIPSRNEASAGEMRGFEEKSRRLKT